MQYASNTDYMQLTDQKSDLSTITARTFGSIPMWIQAAIQLDSGLSVLQQQALPWLSIR